MMIKLEKEFLATLSPKEKQMMSDGFSICDVAWGRFNSEKLHIRNCDEFNDYYCNIIDYATILEHEKDYNRAAAINVQRAIVEVSGLDLTALADGKYQYLPAGKIYVYGGPFYTLHDYIAKKKLTKNFVLELFTKIQGFLPRTLLPFRYVSGKNLLLLMERLEKAQSEHPGYVGTLKDLMPDMDFAKAEKALTEKGYIKPPKKNDTYLSLDDMMNDPDFE